MTCDVCSHFEAIDGKKNCRIGEPVNQNCGPGCLAYLPDSERTPCEVWAPKRRHTDLQDAQIRHS